MKAAPAPLDLLDCPLQGTTLIEASAGTGKTWTICGLYLRLLLERGLDVREILVVTFTNAATAELRARVRARIVDALRYARDGVADPRDPFVADLVAHAERVTGLTRDAIAARLDAAHHSLDEAAILTIHGFARRALADTPFASGLPLAVELVTDDRDIRQQVVNDFWRRNVAAAGLAPALAAHLADRRDTPESFAALVARRTAKPFAEMRFPPEVGATPPPDSAMLDARFAEARATWQTDRDAVAAIMTTLAPGTLRGNTYTPRAIARALAGWDAWLRAGDPLAPFPKDTRQELLTTGRLEECANKGRVAPVHRFFDAAQALAEAREALRADLVIARLALIRKLLQEAPAQIRRRKREARIAGYDDLLLNLRDALSSEAFPGLPARLRAQYRAALIDEFQDTDPL
ncbi:MAG: UvrD-helicase domain-containing protein, partial [Betaproteobacteria bacterium]